MDAPLLPPRPSTPPHEGALALRSLAERIQHLLGITTAGRAAAEAPDPDPPALEEIEAGELTGPIG